MSFLGRLLSPLGEWMSDVIHPAAWVIDWIAGGTRTRAGKRVSPETALAYSAVYRAVSLISGQTATLPLHVYRRLGDNDRERVSGHPVEQLFNVRANEELDALAFVELMVSWVMLWGNGYAWIERRGPLVVGLWPLKPWMTELKRRDSGNARSPLVYEHIDDAGERHLYAFGDVLHLKNLTRDGLRGRSIVTHARESIGLGLSTQEFLASFYENNATPAGALVSKATIPRKRREEWRREWRKTHGGPESAGSVAVLHGDMDFKQFGMSMLDAQFLENRKFNVLEVARMFGVPPHLLFDLDRATFSNIEAQGIEWLTYGLRYWLTKVARMANGLFSDRELADGLYCEHEPKALLMTDAKTQAEAFNTGLQAGYLCVNDVRKSLNMSPIGAAGDVFRVQSNMIPADDLTLPHEQRNPPKPQPVERLPQQQSPDVLLERGDLNGRAD